MREIMFTIALAGCLCMPAFSGTIFYSVTGLFPASGTPTTTFSANNTAFEIDFSLPDTPAPIYSNPGTFGVAPSVTYKLGATTFSPQAPTVGFFTAGSGGGSIFLSFFNGADSFSYNGIGPQLFTGPTSAPVMTPGIFPMTSGTAFIQIDLLQVGGTVTATDAPEPASFGLAGLALLAIALVCSSRRHRHGASNRV